MRRLSALLVMVALIVGSFGFEGTVNPVYATGSSTTATVDQAKEALQRAGTYYASTNIGTLADWEMALAIQSINQQVSGSVDLSAKLWPTAPDPTYGAYAPILYDLLKGNDASAKVSALLASQGQTGAFATNANDHAWAMITLEAADALPAEQGKQAALYLLNQPFDGANGGFSSSFGPSLDATGVVAMALHPYVNDPDLSTSVSAIASYLVSQQSADGGYASWGTVNASTTAYVVDGLSALGVNPFHVRYQGTGPSVIDALLAFQNTDGSFFYPESDWSPSTTGPGTVDPFSMKQVPQALWAAIATAESPNQRYGSAYNALLTKSYIQYGTVEANPVNTQPSTPQETQDTATLRVIGFNGTTTYTVFARKTFALNDGETAYSILARSGLPIGGSSSYVASIDGLTEKSYGPTSGWKYTINGSYPSIGAGSYLLENGDSVVWRYEGAVANELVPIEDLAGAVGDGPTTSPSAIAEQRFHDIKQSDWYAEAIGYLTDKGIVNGTSQTTFSPNKSITRAELVTLLAKMSGVEPTPYTNTGFSDVAKTDWYATSVEWARQEGVVNGYMDPTGKATFHPNAPITRQDLAVILQNYAVLLARESLDHTVDAVVFQDRSMVAEYAKTAVTSMQRAGVLSGVERTDGTYVFYPKRTATRGETAVMLMRMINNTKVTKDEN